MAEAAAEFGHHEPYGAGTEASRAEVGGETINPCGGEIGECDVRSTIINKVPGAGSPRGYGAGCAAAGCADVDALLIYSHQERRGGWCGRGEAVGGSLGVDGALGPNGVGQGEGLLVEGEGSGLAGGKEVEAQELVGAVAGLVDVEIERLATIFEWLASESDGGDGENTRLHKVLGFKTM